MPFPGPIAVTREMEQSDWSDLGQAGEVDELTPAQTVMRAYPTGARERENTMTGRTQKCQISASFLMSICILYGQGFTGGGMGCGGEETIQELAENFGD